MASETWAEGSGSTWEDRDGDPRIEAGAEVLVGCRCFEGSTPECEEWMGRRATVAVAHGGYVCLRGLGAPVVCARDLVCLRTADGKLTEEGAALEWLLSRVNIARAVWQSHDWTDEQTSPGMGVWLARAGITAVKIGEPRYFGVDPRRLAMALGRDEDVRSAVAELMRLRPAAPPPPAPVLCSRCGVQPVRMCGPLCSDCSQEVDDMLPRHEDDRDPPDYSGERHMHELRAWVRRPMGGR